MIYMIQCGEDGPVKIGRSNNPLHRLIQLQISHSETLRIIRVFEGGEPEERALHKRFADQHIRGEWHSYSPLMMDDVGLAPLEVPKPPSRKRRTHDIGTDNVEPSVIELFVEIQDFLVRRDMSETAFGLGAVNDAKLIGRMREGKDMYLSTLNRARAFMQQETA